MTDETQTPRYREAYNRLIDEIRKVSDSDLVTINIDVPAMITTIVGAVTEIRRIRPMIVTDMPTFDLERFDTLESYALALGHAHTLYLTASAPAESIEALGEEAAAKRELLLSDATALAARGLINGHRIKELKGPVGYRNLAFDLFMLATVLRENLEAIAGKSPVQPAELDLAETLADRLMTAVGMREQAPVVLAETTEVRQRAFALCVGAYDHARRAVSFLRWTHGDLDEIAPSLYSGRGNRRKPEPAQPTTPSPAPTAPATTPATDPAQPASNTSRETNNNAVGFPDSSPYANQ